LLANLISEDPKPARIKGIINDQLLLGKWCWQNSKSIHAPVKDDFSEDFFFGQGGDKIYHIIVPVFGSHDELIGKLRIGF